MTRRMSTIDEIPATARPLNEAAEVASSLPLEPQPKIELSGSYEPWPNEVEFNLPDGRIIVMKPPTASLPFLSAKLLADVKFESPLLLQAEIATVNALLFIYSIDGQVIQKPSDGMSRANLEQQIGARFVDLIVAVHMESFPGVNRTGLKILKK